MKKVTLNKPHIHNGTAYAAGAEIDVNQEDIHWLVRQHVINRSSMLPEKTMQPSRQVTTTKGKDE